MQAAIDRQNLTSQALPMFIGANFHAKLHRTWAQLTRRCFCLKNLEDVIRQDPLISSHYAGIKSIDIRQIRGTEGKANEFDAEFNPTQERSRDRWLRIAIEKMSGRDLPPVELIQIGDIYYVRDGHHRISVSRSMGQDFIDAEVTVMNLRDKMNRQ